MHSSVHSSVAPLTQRSEQQLPGRCWTYGTPYRSRRSVLRDRLAQRDLLHLHGTHCTWFDPHGLPEVVSVRLLLLLLEQPLPPSLERLFRQLPARRQLCGTRRRLRPFVPRDRLAMLGRPRWHGMRHRSCVRRGLPAAGPRSRQYPALLLPVWA